MQIISKIILYNDSSLKNLSLSEIKEYLESKLYNVEIILREDFFSFQSSHQQENSKEQDMDQLISKLAHSVVGTRVRDLTDPNKTISPLNPELKIEERLLREPSWKLHGIFYDGIKLHNSCQELLQQSEIDQTTCHIIFTSRLFGTFDEFDKRYHARVILCGYPSIISTSGVVDAPAKPKEYYKIKQRVLSQNIATIDEFVRDELKEKYLKYDDKRLTEVMKGYVMQVVFYHLLSDPFCTDPNCRLYNAHWQEELIQAQFGESEFCLEHEELLDQFNKQ